MNRPDTSLDHDILRNEERAMSEGLGALDPRSLHWLALLPEWTEGLARSCDFPTGPDGLDAELEKARRLELCEVRRERDIAGEETLRFWMPNSARATLLQRLEMRAGLDDEVRDLAGRVLGLTGEASEQVSDGVRRWAELASEEMADGTVTGGTLTRNVSRSLAEDDINSVNKWIVAGEILGSAVGAGMDFAASRAQRRLDYYFRQAQDARELLHFIPRAEQIAELERLISADKQWAVHFIGPSGRGKTMLMRYLTNRAVSPIPTSTRIDFDYIDPRFPLESPARLLHELGEGLAMDLEDGTQEALFRVFREAVREAEAIPTDPAHDPLDGLRSPSFKRVVAAFAAFVNELPQPVGLILDTCEELAKLHPPGEDVPSIRATFEILEQVHAAADGVRVIFAGRRWLTPEPANRPPRVDSAPGSVMCMESRPYMRMQAVRGFTREEVVEYLEGVCGERPRPEILEGILEITVDAGQATKMDEGKDDDGDRYSPTDVSLLGGWLKERPDLDVESLTDGSFDPFVEARILGRLASSPGVLTAIPAAILLERFDAETIRPALGNDAAARAVTLNGLLEQEWTHLDGGPDPEEIQIEVDRGLLRRLRGYYERTRERSERLEAARGRLVPHLTALMRRAPSGAGADAIDAALRLLPIARAVADFDELAGRVAAESAWPWAEEVCSRLLSPEREPPLDEALSASVGALYVAALRHRRSSVNLAPLWNTVAEESARHPDPRQATSLRIRGRLGALAAAAANGGFDKREAAELLTESTGVMAESEGVAPALLATVESLVDAAEERRYPVSGDVVGSCLRALDGHFGGDEPVHAHILTLEGRLRVTEGDWQAARVCFDRLERMPLQAEGEEPRFVDWVPPDSMSHRALLELLRFRLTRREEGGGLLERCERAALERGDGADAAQLLSLALQARLARGELDAVRDKVGLVARYEAIVEGYRMVAPAHRVAPPLFVSVAEALFAIGRATPALSLLAERERVATSRRTNEDAAVAAALATLKLLRRLRRQDRLALIGGFVSEDDEGLRREGLAAATLLVGLQPPAGRGGRDHVAWRARNLLDPDGDEALSPPRRPLDDRGAELDDALDRVEAAIVHRRSRRRFFPGRQEREARVIAEAWQRELKPTLADPLATEDLRLELRAAALLVGWDEDLDRLDGERPGLVGAIALEEGELLALRLPDQGAWLLDVAERSLAAAGDPHGAFVASLRRAIALVHAGREEAARMLEDRVLGHYGTARALNDELPRDPDRSGGIGGDGDDEEDVIWGPWLTRLASYLAWCRNPPPSQGAGMLSLDPELTLAPAVTKDRPEVEEKQPITEVHLDGIDLSIAFAPDDADGEPRFEAWTERWPRGLRDRLWALVRRLIGVPPPSRYFPLREPEAGPAAATKLAEALGPLLDRPRQPIRLAVTSDLAPIDWERRLIGHLLGRKDRDRAALPEVWRVRPRGMFTLPPGEWNPSLTAVCSPLWRPMIAASAGDGLEVSAASELPPPRHDRHAGVAIALGSPVFTQAGWRLRLDDDQLSWPLDDLYEAHSQDLLSPDRLVAEAPVVIVFGRPSGPRAAADARSSRGLRGFANEVFLAGAHAVVTVPVLPADQAAEAIAFVARRIPDWGSMPDQVELRSFAEGLRAAACGAGSSGDVELALDVCLYAPR